MRLNSFPFQFKMWTSSVCLLCLKTFNNESKAGKLPRQRELELKLSSQNATRFMAISERFLKLPKKSKSTISILCGKQRQSSSRTSLSSSSSFLDHFCSECREILGNTFQLYEELCEVELKLAWRLGQWEAALKNSNKRNITTSSKLTSLLHQKLSTQLQLERKQVEKIRNLLLSHCKTTRNRLVSRNLKVRLDRCSVPEIKTDVLNGVGLQNSFRVPKCENEDEDTQIEAKEIILVARVQEEQEDSLCPGQGDVKQEQEDFQEPAEDDFEADNWTMNMEMELEVEVDAPGGVAPKVAEVVDDHDDEPFLPDDESDSEPKTKNRKRQKTKKKISRPAKRIKKRAAPAQPAPFPRSVANPKPKPAQQQPKNEKPRGSKGLRNRPKRPPRSGRQGLEHQHQFCKLCLTSFLMPDFATHLSTVHPDLCESFVRCKLCNDNPENNYKFEVMSMDFIDYFSHLHQFHNNALKACTICPDEVFERVNELRRHYFHIHQIGTEYACDFENCTRTFLIREGLAAHKRNFHQDDVKLKEKFACEFCLKSGDKRLAYLKSQESLDQHLESQHHEGRFKCKRPECTAGFRCKFDLREHEINDHPNDPLICDRCDSQFRHSRDLTNHQKKIHVAKETGKAELSKSGTIHKCPVCSKGFRSETHMKLHMVTHSAERKFKCLHPGCGKDYKTAGALRIHSKLHLPGGRPRPFVCEVCSDAFHNKQQFINHGRIHTGERPYSCQYCGMTFRHSGTLRNHEMGHKRNEQGFRARGPFERSSSRNQPTI